MEGLRPINLKKIDEKVPNVYEGVIVAAKRARQINDENRMEYNSLVSSMIPATEDEFEDKENSDLIRVSMDFEKRPKPHVRGLNQLLEEGVKYRFKDSEPAE